MNTEYLAGKRNLYERMLSRDETSRPFSYVRKMKYGQVNRKSVLTPFFLFNSE